MKTLAQCVKIRTTTTQAQALTAQASINEDVVAKQPYNALLLYGTRFGLTIEEIDAALRHDYAAHPATRIQTSFLPSEEVVLKGSGSWAPQALESSLTSLKATITPTIRRLGLAKGVSLCHVDDSLNVLRREEDTVQARNDGWSAVIGRSAARQKPTSAAAVAAAAVASSAGGGVAAAEPVRSRFVALRKEPKKKKKAMVEEPVDEDWEAAAEKLDVD